MIDPKHEQTLRNDYSEEAWQALQDVLNEIGDISPVWDEACGEYGFYHPNYPSVEAPGETPEDCVETYYRLMLKFLSERLKNNLAPHVEKMTSGRGGKRVGSGRPKGITTIRVSLPMDVAQWIRDPNNLERIRKLMA